MQSAVAPHVALLGASPDLPLLLTASLGLVAGPIPAMAVGFSTGLLAGALDRDSPGLLAALLTLVGYLAGALRARLFVENWPIAVLVVALLSLGFYTARLLLSGPQAWAYPDRAAAAAGSALYNAILACPAFILLRRARRLLPGAAGAG